MRILTISQQYYIKGGSDSMFFSISELLKRKGHEVIPFTAAHESNRPTPWSSYFPVAANFESPGLRDLARFIYSRPAKRAIEQLIADHRPDVAHLHIYYGKLTTSILRPLREAGIPIVQSLHEYKSICPVYTLISHGEICEACEGRHFWRALPRTCNRGSITRTALSVAESYTSRWLGSLDSIDHFLAVSDFVREKMIQYGVPPERITTLMNYVDPIEVQPAGDIGDTIVYYGRVEAVKGVFTLVEAIGGLDIPLLIVGDGEAKPELQALVARQGWENVRFQPFQSREKLAAILRASLCTVLPSMWYEPFGMTILETFQFARPVIASAIGGIPEVVKDGFDGNLVPPGDVQALREAIISVVNHPDRAQQMGRMGHEMMRHQFGPEQFYQQLMDVYDRVRS